MRLLNKFFSLLSVFLLLFYQVSVPLIALAQESSSSTSEEQIAEPALEPSPSPSETPAPTLEPSPTLTPTPALDENLTTPPATQSTIIDTSTTENQSSASLAPPVWQDNADGSVTTTNIVSLNTTYQAPQNIKVTVTFNKLPENPGTLSIKEIKLTAEQIQETNSLSDTAYDITSTMENGTFEYTLTLPTPKTENVEVKASEDGETFVTLGGVTAQGDALTITGLNHFTIFVTTATGGGSIPADTTGGSFADLTGPTLTEGAARDISFSGDSGTLILNIPSGFEFRTTTNSVTATVTDLGTCPGTRGNKPIRLSGNNTSQTVTPTASSITITVDQESSGNCSGSINWSGIGVRPTAGAPLASGNITFSGTVTINGATASSTNLGTLSEVAGAVNAGTSTAGASPSSVPADGTTTSTVTVTLKDAFGNPVSGKTVSLSSSRGGPDTISAPSGLSDSNGVVTFTVTSSTVGTATFTAVGDSVTITQTVDVTFTITTGTIIIVKDAISNNIQDFTFHNNFGNGNPDTFLLDDDGNAANALPKTRSFEVTPGNYSVSEDDVAGWKLSSAFCDNGSSVDNISVSAGETVTCTFTNKQLGTIILVKDTIGGDGTFDFEMSGQSLPSFTQITTTQGSGSQTFNDIDPDSAYGIRESIPDGWDLTDISCVQDNGIVKGNDGFEIATGATVTCTFTNTQFGSISGYKFHDVNGDRVWDDDEDPIEDWTILLYQNGEVINYAYTEWWEWGDWGFYSFENLLPGTYLVCEEIDDPDYWAQSTPWDNSLCPDGTNGHQITLAAGENVTDQNFGNFQYGSISGYKFEDTNGDGVWDLDEYGLPEWTIYLDTNDNGQLDEGEPSTITYSNENAWGYSQGYFEFTNLRPATYRVREIPQEGWVQTTANPEDIVITSGTNQSQVNFGNFKKVLITGLKWKDLDADGQLDEGEPGIGGWNIDVSSVTTTSLIPDGGGEPVPIEIVQLQLTSQTNQDGQFSAMVDRPGTYRITEQPQDNFQNTWPVDSFFDVFVEVSGQTNEGQTSITEDKNDNPLRFGNAPIVQVQGATFVLTSNTQVMVLGSSTISVSDNGGISTVELPAGTIITRTDGEPIDISELTADDVTESSLTGLASGVVVDGALQWGLNDIELNFNPAITVSIFVGTALNGQTLNVFRSTTGDGGWTSDGIVTPATCVVTDGQCSFTATKASYYATTHTPAPSPTPTPTPTPTSSTSSTSGGGGGGGGGAGTPVCNDPAAGGAPTLLSAIVGGPNQVILNWLKALDPVTHYVVTYGLTPGAQQYGNPSVGGKDTTSYTVSSLSGNTTYYFRVRAGNGCNAGAYSNELSATPGGGVVTGPAAGFAPGVLGVATESGNVGVGQEGQVQGETTESAQPSISPAPQTGSSPFNVKVIAIVVIILLLGFGAFRLLVK